MKHRDKLYLLLLALLGTFTFSLPFFIALKMFGLKGILLPEVFFVFFILVLVGIRKSKAEW